MIVLIVSFSFMTAPDNKIEEDYVPDKKTAIKIAEAIWLPIYGEDIYKMEPFKAKLIDENKTWLVRGSLPKNSLGGVPIIEIRKSDCKIIRVTHTK